MTNNDDPIEITKEEEQQVEEEELDPKVVERFSSKIEYAVNKVFDIYFAKDCRMELLVVLISFAAQVSSEIGIDDDSFLELALNIQERINEQMKESAVNNNTLN
jgi:uncharacterized phage protein gp47/JayE